MALRTSNGYGAITVSDEVVASIVGKLAVECYGVVDKVPQKFSDSVADLFRKKNRPPVFRQPVPHFSAEAAASVQSSPEYTPPAPAR